jgi:hypothetical protein
MWTGHVLHVAALYETLTGDARYRRPRGLRARDDAGRVAWASDAHELALHLAACMRVNATGGVPCEPGASSSSFASRRRIDRLRIIAPTVGRRLTRLCRGLRRAVEDPPCDGEEKNAR